MISSADAARSAQVFEQTLRATSTEDPLFRGRLVAWLRCALRVPDAAAQVLAEARKHAALFDAADCPEKLRAEYRQLTAQKQSP